MNREEKNQVTKNKIKDSAMTEFAKHGYEAASLNVICKNGGISKGIIYHYFESKEDLYLCCVEECFLKLTVYLQKYMKKTKDFDMLSEYFDVRSKFFRDNEELSGLFRSAVLFPPNDLISQIKERRSLFDKFNRSVLHEIIEEHSVRKDLKEEEIFRVFDEFQDFLNTGYRNANGSKESLMTHEDDCRNALNIFLYGILRRN